MTAQSILVVDDEPDMRVALTHVLIRTGYSVDCASCGSEALLKFKRGGYSLVITDVKMPEMSGLKLLGKVKKMSPQVPVIMITGYGTINNAVEAMQKGASDYILKPFSSDTLEAVVKNVNIKSNNPARNGLADIDILKNSGAKKMITRDRKLLNILEMAKEVALSNATVLIQGESGTGKEILASIIHHYSGNGERPYVCINCAALPDTLAESELFGHEKGSFTGATSRKTGKFELANRGTILLDEISEMAMPLQAKLLRALQEKEIDRIGGTRPVPIDSRIIAISNIDLKKAVKAGKFREDLYYRLNVIPFTIPPLRERKCDILLLTKYFLEKYSLVNNRNMTKIAENTKSLLMKHDWKGNVRELENYIERAVLLGKGDTLLPEHILFDEPDMDTKKPVPVKVGLSVKEMERELIFHTLNEVDDNRTRAAELLGISIRTLRNKLREYKVKTVSQDSIL